MTTVWRLRLKPHVQSLVIRKTVVLNPGFKNYYISDELQTTESQGPKLVLIEKSTFRPPILKKLIIILVNKVIGPISI